MFLSNVGMKKKAVWARLHTADLQYLHGPPGDLGSRCGIHCSSALTEESVATKVRAVKLQLSWETLAESKKITSPATGARVTAHLLLLLNE